MKGAVEHETYPSVSKAALGLRLSDHGEGLLLGLAALTHARTKAKAAEISIKGDRTLQHLDNAV